MLIRHPGPHTHTALGVPALAGLGERRRYRRRRVNSSPSVGLLRVPTPALIYHTRPYLPPPHLGTPSVPPDSSTSDGGGGGGDPSCGFYGANPCGSLKARYSGEGRFLQPARPAPLSAGFSTVEVTLIATFTAHGCHGRQHSRPADRRFYGPKCACVCSEVPVEAFIAS